MAGRHCLWLSGIEHHPEGYDSAPEKGFTLGPVAFCRMKGLCPLLKECGSLRVLRLPVVRSPRGIAVKCRSERGFT